MRANRLVHGVLTTAVLMGCGESTAVAPGSIPAGDGGGDSTAVAVIVGTNFFRSNRNGSMNAAVDTIIAGGKVTWKWANAGSVPHNVQSVGMPSFPSGDVKTGDGSTYELTFTTPGTYRYNCAIHGNLMTGVVVVTAPTARVSTVPRDIVMPGLPSPYYHFERDASGRITRASFASGFTTYDVVYDGGRLSEMRSTRVDSLFREIGTVVTRDRLLYIYDDAGRVSEVRYADSTGAVYTRVHFAYDGRRLTRLERERRSDNGFFVDKTMSFSYDADGNVLEIAQRRTSIPGSPEGATYVDRFEQYDGGINVDGFSLLHDEISDHLVLLPDVQLQKGNPRRQTRSGDGLNFRVDYSYTYDDRNRPLTKNGDATVLTGDDAGRRFQLSSVFSY